MKRGPVPCSPAQRAKVDGQPCTNCGACVRCHPAHVADRSLGGCTHPDCVIPLCPTCHRAYDEGNLDILGSLEPRHRAELAHAVTHLGLVRALARVTNVRWAPAPRTRAAA